MDVVCGEMNTLSTVGLRPYYSEATATGEDVKDGRAGSAWNLRLHQSYCTGGDVPISSLGAGVQCSPREERTEAATQLGKHQ